MKYKGHTCWKKYHWGCQTFELDWPVLGHKVWRAAHATTAQCCASSDEQVKNLIVANAVDPRIPEQNLRLWWVYFGAELRCILSTDIAFFTGIWIYVAENGGNRTHLKTISVTTCLFCCHKFCEMFSLNRMKHYVTVDHYTVLIRKFC